MCGKLDLLALYLETDKKTIMNCKLLQICYTVQSWSVICKDLKTLW